MHLPLSLEGEPNFGDFKFMHVPMKCPTGSIPPFCVKVRGSGGVDEERMLLLGLASSPPHFWLFGHYRKKVIIDPKPSTSDLV